MRSLRLISTSVLLFLIAAAAIPGLQAQVCSYGNGGGSSSGGGGATLNTITIDGDATDWGPVLANPIQVTHDGEWVNCATSTDKDYTNTPGCQPRSITGRDLSLFTWTYDSTNIFLYVKRFGSASNTQTFYFYMDTNGNQRMNTGEKVYQVQLSGSNRRTDGKLYNYAAADGTNGDPLVAPTGVYAGYADGYTLVGSLNLASETVIYSNVTGGFADGTGFEARIPWTNIGVPAGTAIYFHVSSTNSSNPGQVPASIDDNLGGVDGKAGAFAYYSTSVTPDRSSAVSSGSPTVVEYLHTVTNTGTLPDGYNLTAFSSRSFRVDLYDNLTSTLMATDINGDGDFIGASEYVNSSYDSDLDGRPNTPVLSPSGTFVVRIRITAPTGVTNVQDATTLSAFSMGNSSLCASAKDTTAIGALALTPSPQAKSVVANQTADYGLTLGNYSLGDTFDLKVTSSQGWQVQIYTDPNGDGSPADGVLVATDLNGNGVYTDGGDSITGGYDSNTNSRPDFGSVSNGSAVKFVVRLTAPAGATVGTVDTTTVLAQGATYGSSTTATLTTTVRTRLTFTPSYTVTAGTNKYSGQGQSVYYAHTLINSWPSSDTITLSSTSSPAWTVRYYTDPDGDGNPTDGALITGAFSLAGNGGTLKLVAEVVIPSGLTLPVSHTALVTATGAGSAPAVTDQVRVSYVATFADTNRTLSKRVFSLCQTIYTLGSSLMANSSYTFHYLDPSSLVIRSQTVLSDGNGEALDQYTLASGDNRGIWTIELHNASNVFVDSIAVFVDPPPSDPSTVSPLATSQASYALTGDNLSISATFNNTSTGADYAGTTYRYLVRSSDLSQYLRSDGVFATYMGSELTRSTSPHTVNASSSASETVSVNGVEFPGAGVYRLDVTWLGSCGNTIATAALNFPVGTTLTSYGDAAHAAPRDYFDTGSTVYLSGTTYFASTAYKVAYFDANGVLQLTQSVTSAPGGSLSTNATEAILGTAGLWHAVVYQATLSPPPVYNSADPQATSQDAFTLDFTSPTVTVNTLVTTDTTPALSGTVSDPSATVQVIVNGITYAATNNGDGNWTLPDNTISPALAQGVYDVTVLATDLAGNVGSDNTSNELTIQHPAPVVSGPIVAGTSSISGTSASPSGTIITIYKNGVSIGTATITAGAWTLGSVTGLAGGEAITAKAAVGTSSESAVSNTVVVTPVPPVVNSPIIAGATAVSGTSTAPTNSTINVYKNGVSIGTATVQAGGVWTLSGIDPVLEALDSITATAAVGGATSGPSAAVIVDPAPILDPSIPPIVTASLLAGGSQTIYGSSVEPAGSAITVYINGVAQATQPVVQADGSWSLPGVTLSAGDLVKATVFSVAPNKTDSAFGNLVTVSANSGSVTSPPVITPGIPANATSVSGTSAANATVDVYADGVYLGTVTASGSGNWTLGPGIGPLASGAIVTATATEPGKGTSDWSGPIIVGTIMDMLRSDAMTTLAPPPSSLFTHKPKLAGYPSLETLGPNHRANGGEQGFHGAAGQPESVDTADDDKFYLSGVTSGTADPDTKVLDPTDPRKLIFYELLDNDAKTLKLSKSGGNIVFIITP